MSVVANPAASRQVRYLIEDARQGLKDAEAELARGLRLLRPSCRDIIACANSIRSYLRQVAEVLDKLETTCVSPHREAGVRDIGRTIPVAGNGHRAAASSDPGGDLQQRNWSAEEILRHEA